MVEMAPYLRGHFFVNCGTKLILMPAYVIVEHQHS